MGLSHSTASSGGIKAKRRRGKKKSAFMTLTRSKICRKEEERPRGKERERRRGVYLAQVKYQTLVRGSVEKREEAEEAAAVAGKKST